MAFTTGPNGELLDENGNPVDLSGGNGGSAPDPGLSGAGGGPGLATDPAFNPPPAPPAALPPDVAPPPGLPPPVVPQTPPQMPPGAGGMVKTGSSTTSTRETAEEKKLRAEQKGARTEYDNATQKLATPTGLDRELVSRTNAVNTQSAEDAKATADAAAKAAADASAERERLTAERNAKIQQAQAASDAEKQKYADMKIRDYFGAGAPGEGKKGQVLLGIALSGLGNAIARTPGASNPALDQMNLQIERFHKSEVERIAKQAETWKMSGMSVEAAERQKAADLHDLDAKTAAVRENIAQEARAKAAQRGLPAAQIENDSAIQKLDKAAAAADLERKQRAMEYVDKDLAHQASLRSHTVTTHVVQEGGKTGKGAAEDRAAVYDKYGKYLGDVTSGKGGAQAFATRDANYDEAIEKGKALLKKFPEGGVTLTDTASKGAIANAIAAAVTVTNLPKNEETMHLEAQTMGVTQGPLGTSYVNPEVLRKWIAQKEETRNNYRTQGLQTMANGKVNEPRTSIPKESPGTPSASPPPQEDRIAINAQIIKAKSAPAGETKTLSDGRKVRKVGANQWEVVQ
jgi:hypothetical protein